MHGGSLGACVFFRRKQPISTSHVKLTSSYVGMSCRCCPERAPLRVAVLLSGGVDSSLALALLKAAGHEVHAFYLQIWFQEDFRNFWDSCPWKEDLDYAQKVIRAHMRTSSRMFSVAVQAACIFIIVFLLRRMQLTAANHLKLLPQATLCRFATNRECL